MKKIILTLCFLMSALDMFGQEVTLPEIFSPSPTAAELGKYGSYPVNLSTGLPTIEIPLYTIKAGDIELPIKLKYHASGIKVNQMPTWVGLGWSLDTGGLISLDTRDTPDELEPNPYDIPNIQDLQNSMANDPYNFQNQDIKYVLQNSWVKDAYHINLPTVSGTFFLDSDTTGEVTTKFPPEKYQIFSGSSFHDGYLYKVIDKQGTQYNFSDVEYSQLNKTTNEIGQDYHIYNKKYKSGWLLSNITDIKGNNINFTYGNEYYMSSLGESHSQSYFYTFKIEDEKQEYDAVINPWKKSISFSTIFANKIQKITFPNGRIRFITNSNSQYSGAGVYLDRIIVEEGTDDKGYTPLKTILFSYSTTGAPIHYTSTNSNKYRFKLDKVTDAYHVGEDKDIAVFEYASIELPKQNSYNIDFFGLYNGKNNQNLIPRRTIQFNNSMTSTRTEVIGTADRNINETYMHAGMLTKINYPTKGYTEFEYEPNSYFARNSFLTDEQATYSLDIIGEGDGNIDPDTEFYCMLDPNHELCYLNTETVSLDLPTSRRIDLTGTITCTNCDPTTSKHSRAKITVINNGEVIYQRVGYSNELHESVNVNPGKTNITLEVYGEQVKAHIIVSYRKQIADLPFENVKGFGLRVKSITNYDHDASFLNKKEYDYSTPGTNNSSGKLINKDSKYDRLSDYRYYHKSSCLRTSDYSDTYTYTYSSSSKTGFENNSIIYEFVTEYNKDENGNSKGKTIYNYTTQPNFVADTNNGSIWVNLGYERGQVLKKEVLDNQNRKLLLEENYYTENTSISSSRQDFKAYDHASSNSTSSGSSCGPPFSINDTKEFINTNLYTYWYKKDKTELTEYFYEGNIVDSLKTITDYTYSNQNQEVKTTITTNSQNETIENSYKYAHDVSDQTLINQNRIAVPLEVTNSKNSQIVFNQKTKYTPYSSLYLPSEVFIKKGGLADVNSATDRRLIYDNYDAKGNITQYHLENGIYTSVIWGYHDQYPIAKLENTTLTGLTSAQQTLINAAKAASNSDTTPATENNLRTLLNNLRNGFPNAMVTTYTYDPLVGVTSVTDPKVQTIYYEYDDFNRLKFVKDHEGNLISENKYHYKNQ